MGLYESDHPDVPGMKGLHLFHFALSNCSQRVRLGLEEKGLAWTSHHLDLPGNEHVTSDYRRINPNGVVPALVHDGQVDISWVVNANRLQQAQVDTSAWPRYRDWAARAMARPAFDRAVTSYQS